MTMNLYDQANLDNQYILSDVAAGFGVPITVIDPDGNAVAINGMASDVGLTIDPETGQTVSGRRVHVTLPLADLDATVGRPQVIQATHLKPWRMQFALPSETTESTFRVTETMPDRLGCMVMFVEEWTP